MTSRPTPAFHQLFRSSRKGKFPFQGTIVLVEHVAMQVSWWCRAARVGIRSRRVWRSRSRDRARHAPAKSCPGSSRSSRPLAEESEPRQPLRAVIGNRNAGDLLKRAVWLRGVPYQLRGVPVDLVEKGAIRRNPAIARSAADVPTKPPECAIALDFGARRILRDFDLGAVDMEGGDVAVPENRSVHESVIGGDGQPAKFSDRASPCVDRYDLVDANSAVFVNTAQADSVTDGVCEDESIRSVV